MVPLFWSVGERSRAKYYLPVRLLSVISKVLEQLVNNRLLGQLDGVHVGSSKYTIFRIFKEVAF